MIKGKFKSDLDHSVCRYNLQFELRLWIKDSAHNISLWWNTIGLNSSAIAKVSGIGNLNFLGERHIQSGSPNKGYAPEVSICERILFNFTMIKIKII